VRPELAIADGALGFWKAAGEVWPTTREQRCWVHYADFRIMPSSSWMSAPEAVIAAMGSA
jgi:transposase-like protein